MKKNAVICAIEHVLRDEGRNEISAGEVYSRVRKTRGNYHLTLDNFLAVLTELESDGLFESLIEEPVLSDSSLIARSQMHPSVP
jgi:hypothetical protein